MKGRIGLQGIDADLGGMQRAHIGQKGERQPGRGVAGGQEGGWTGPRDRELGKTWGGTSTGKSRTGKTGAQGSKAGEVKMGGKDQESKNRKGKVRGKDHRKESRRESRKLKAEGGWAGRADVSRCIHASDCLPKLGIIMCATVYNIGTSGICKQFLHGIACTPR